MVTVGRVLTLVWGYGEWIKWLTESVSCSRSTASRLMKIFREYGPEHFSVDGEEGSNGASMQHLNYTQGIILFGIPEEDREQFIEDNDVGSMSQRELRQTIKEFFRGFIKGQMGNIFGEGKVIFRTRLCFLLKNT
ncbi:DUF3102 domain-containing protein [Desulfitobacterium dehalogenans]|nr:DUF3102 domain-containing protein [Desulfitobacterium dehalogenans]